MYTKVRSVCDRPRPASPVAPHQAGPGIAARWGPTFPLSEPTCGRIRDRGAGLLVRGAMDWLRCTLWVKGQGSRGRDCVAEDSARGDVLLGATGTVGGSHLHTTVMRHGPGPMHVTACLLSKGPVRGGAGAACCVLADQSPTRAAAAAARHPAQARRHGGSLPRTKSAWLLWHGVMVKALPRPVLASMSWSLHGPDRQKQQQQRHSWTGALDPLSSSK